MSIIQRIKNRTWEDLLGNNVNAKQALEGLGCSVDSEWTKVVHELREYEQTTGEHMDFQGVYSDIELSGVAKARDEAFPRMARQLLKDAAALDA